MEEERSSSGLDINFAVILHNFINAAKRLIWIALILALAVGAFRYYRLDSSYQPVYSSSVVFSVQASYASTTDIGTRSNWLDSSAAATLSQTFPYIIRSENTKMLLELELGKSIPANSITATSTADAGLFTMTATAYSPQDAFDIMNAAITIYPQAASSILGDTQIHIINIPLEPPTTPDNANNAFSSALTFAAITFVVCVLVILLLSLTRKTVHAAEDLRKLVNLKCLAYIPAVKLKKRTTKANLTLTITNPRVSSAFNESIRNLRVRLQKILNQRDAKVLLVTSTLPNEGKTTVSVNLALSLASEGKRVILIDGDLRKQSLKASVGLDAPSDGLVEILSGNAKNFRLLNVPNSTLLLLSGDETTDRPQPLLDTPRLRQVLELLRSKLDYIIIDTPPAGILSDAATFAKYADATLYVVRQDLASTAQILNSIQTLAASDVELIGCVLNQTQAGTTRYGYGSKYHSGYGYKYYGSYNSKGRSRYDEAVDTADELTREISETASSEEEE